MKSIEEIANQEVVTEDLNTQYDNIIQLLQEAKENQTPIDEGVFGALFGGLSGATVGPAIMGAICEALGVDKKGTFGSLLTSRLILTVVGTKLGWKM